MTASRPCPDGNLEFHPDWSLPPPLGIGDEQEPWGIHDPVVGRDFQNVYNAIRSHSLKSAARAPGKPPSRGAEHRAEITAETYVRGIGWCRQAEPIRRETGHRNPTDKALDAARSFNWTRDAAVGREPVGSGGAPAGKVLVVTAPEQLPELAQLHQVRPRIDCDGRFFGLGSGEELASAAQAVDRYSLPYSDPVTVQTLRLRPGPTASGSFLAIVGPAAGGTWAPRQEAARERSSSPPALTERRRGGGRQVLLLAGRERYEMVRERYLERERSTAPAREVGPQRKRTLLGRSDPLAYDPARAVSGRGGSGATRDDRLADAQSRGTRAAGRGREAGGRGEDKERDRER